MKKPKHFELPQERYLITENDIIDILIAYNNEDYDWILYFFEALVPIQRITKKIRVERVYTFEDLLKNVGVKIQGN